MITLHPVRYYLTSSSYIPTRSHFCYVSMATKTEPFDCLVQLRGGKERASDMHMSLVVVIDVTVYIYLSIYIYIYIHTHVYNII